MSSLSQLRQIVQEASQVHELNTVLHLIAEKVLESMQVDVCTVYLSDKAEAKHLLMASAGWEGALPKTLSLNWSQGLVGLVADQLEVINTDNASNNSAFTPLLGPAEASYQSFLGAPVVYRGELLGIIAVIRKANKKLSEEDTAFITTLAFQLADKIALVRAYNPLAKNDVPRVTLPNYIEGGVGAPGVALGTGVVLYSATELEQIPDQITEDVEAEVQLLKGAMEKVAREFESASQSENSRLTADDTALFQALAMITRSPEIIETASNKIRQRSCWAPTALRDAIQEHAQAFDTMDDPYLRERANDIRDIGRRVLELLLPKEEEEGEYPPNTILIGDNLGPIDLTSVPEDRLKAVVCGHGSSLSHLAILARALGIPAVMGIAGLVPIRELDSKSLVIDGYQGHLYIEPEASVVSEYKSLAKQEAALTKDLKKTVQLASQTCDGKKIHLFCNAGLLSDLTHSIDVNAEGIGLFRTEFPFMVRESFPTEEEQFKLYRQVLSKLYPKPVTLRTLDIGGDKPLPYFPVTESNPFLGWRGIRICLDHPDIFLQQTRAMLRANQGYGNLKILIPMANRIEDIDEAIALICTALKQLNAMGIPIDRPLIGVMIEVPSAVYQIDAILKRADFVSIGSNDLIQYLLAVDRNNDKVARWFDALNPAVIQSISMIAKAALRANKEVSICGEVAGNPSMVLLLIGMGIENLSLSAGDLLRIKWVIRSFGRDECRSLLAQALDCEYSGQVKDLLTSALVEKGLGGLTHAGQ